VTLQDRFYVGSIGKSMTATVLARLVERGLLSWDTRVQDVLGLQEDAVTPSFREVTLRQLLSHRSGLPKYHSREAIDAGPRTEGSESPGFPDIPLEKRVYGYWEMFVIKWLAAVIKLLTIVRCIMYEHVPI